MEYESAGLPSNQEYVRRFPEAHVYGSTVDGSIGKAKDHFTPKVSRKIFFSRV